MKSKLSIIFLLTVQFCFGQTFEPNWESLSQYKVPDWYKDAKFGIFMHWGVQSVPAHENGWYARQMYQQKDAQWGHTYDYNLKNYGHPSEFGYKDLIPLWKAENWNPDELVKLYKKIGAKYIVPVAVHHDNFDNYASTYQPWNSVNMGPKRDIIGEWKKACEKYGLRLGVSSHCDRTWTWLATSQGSDIEGDKKGVPYDGNLTKYDGKGKWWNGYDPQDLYTRPHTVNDAPDKAYCQKWYLRTKELIDKYQPDLLWFDGPMPIVCNSAACDNARQSQEKYGLDISSYYYNQNQKWHNGKLEAVLNLKEWKKGDIPNINAVVLDIEKGQTKEILPNYWQTDTSIPGDWFYDSKPAELSDTVIIHNLCDIVSKNGNLLLNVGLRADGSLPDDQLQILLNIGKWLDVNGEAIYGTRPWTVYGEGPTQLAKGDFQQNKKPLTAKDIRYTTKNNKLYAIVMGIPQNGQITLTSLPINRSLWFGNIANIRMLGSYEKIIWKQNDKGLTLNFPKRMSKKQLAYVFEIGNK